jgi:uroporphyrinogen-III synthase
MILTLEVCKLFCRMTRVGTIALYGQGGDGLSPLTNNQRLGRVLYTGPRQYWDRCASSMIRHRLDPIHVPSLVIQGLTEERDISILVESLSNSKETPERVVFPSKNAIYGCIERFDSVEEFRDHWNERPDVELWAMGADADFLGSLGLRNVIKSSSPNTQGIVDDLEKIGKQTRALVYIPKVIEPLVEPPVVPEFLASLHRIGVKPIAIPAYETRIGNRSRCRIELDLLLSGAIQAIAISSQAEVQALLFIAGREVIVDCIERHGILVAAHGQTTAEGIQAELPDVRVVVSRDSSTFDGMAKAVAEGVSS